ncbi:MAG: hypothetical protein HY928_14915 [Elusimicrobia bacterium]|nr:hypothetical protein [Elusimicrobiota bacterium]
MRPARFGALALCGAFPAFAANAAAETFLVRRGAVPPPAVQEWYSSLDALLTGVDALALRSAAAAAAPSGADAAYAASRLSGLLEHVSRVVGPSAAAGVKEVSEKLAAAGRTDGPLGPADAALLADAASRSALRLAGTLRERALEATGPRAAPNALLSEDGADWELPFLAVDGVDGPRATPALAALAAAVRAGGAPEQAAASRRRVWTRSAGVEVFLDLWAPPGSPSVRVRAEAPGPGSLEQSAFYFLARALFECGFSVSAESGIVRAAFGAERAADPEERAERFASAWGAASASRRLAPLLKAHLSETLTRRQGEERVEALARAFAAEGSLPVVGSGPDALDKGMAAWMTRAGARQALRSRMDADLSALGLPLFPAGDPVGQRTIDLRFNGPVAAAMARGEARKAGGRLLRDPRWDPLDRLAAAVPVPGPMRRRLGPALARSLPAGVAAGRRVERGQWRVGPDAWLIVLFARGDDGLPSRMAAEVASSALARRSVSPADALARLEEFGLVAGSEAEGPGALPFDAVAGTPLAGGAPVEGPLTFDAARAAEGKLIFATPFLSSRDMQSAAKARAVVPTAGGPQAQAFAARAGIPGVDVPRGSWDEGTGLMLELPLWKAGPGGGRVASERRRALLREGDKVRVDGRRGTLEILP